MLHSLVGETVFLEIFSGNTAVSKTFNKSSSRGPSTANKSSSIYERVTDQILSALSRGVVPWRKPWKGREFLPCNAASKRIYAGVNLFTLGVAPFSDHRWLTVRQANELGGHVRKGERGSLVVFWKILSGSADDEGSKRTIPLLRHFIVFNVEQIEGASIEPLAQAQPVARIETAEAVVESMPSPPRLAVHSTSAFYRTADDLVAMPRIESFQSADSYYATLFHELSHATGHPSRLNRPGVAQTTHFGSEDYSREELVAELASAFVCAEIGLDNSLIADSASYISGWLDALKRDPKAIVLASSQARRAADFILARHATSEHSAPP